ncbi:hypothetical protein LOC67_02420 [Stieleria sp. JC731]|uniref:hypothetical protein n=1 Tax=Pirellulaceae TaxID=2691357 RepID=UPI001E3252A7|nr:hypothetical protein [Stieleria sp. JC731]MCC9599399.1 hypothetical protein [Stieleria sp. JC731]
MTPYGTEQVRELIGEALAIDDLQRARQILCQFETTLDKPYRDEELRFLQYYRKLAGPLKTALGLAEERLRRVSPNDFEAMSLHLDIADLRRRLSQPEESLSSLETVFNWPELGSYFEVGLVRQLILQLFELASEFWEHQRGQASFG